MKYALTDCTVLDGTPGMEPQEGMSVLVEDGKIAEIAKGKSYAGLKTYDLKGAYLLPGLIDLHVHLAGTGKPVKMPSPAGQNRKKEEKNTEEGQAGRPAKGSRIRSMVFASMEHGFIHKGLVKNVRNNILTKLNSGVTTLRSMGELYWSDLENRDLINAGKYVGPRVLVSGTGVSVPGGHMAGTMAAPCEDIGQAIATVDRACERKADWVKIFVTGGVMDASDSGEPARVRMSYEMAKAACDEAHARGYRVASHAESAEGVRISLRAGVDTVEHGAPMDEEIISLYRRNGASVTVTISPALVIAMLPGSMTGMTDGQRAAAQYVMDGIVASGRQAREHGIPVGLGTDASCPYVTQYDMWREVYYYAKYCGVSNAEALSAATLGNAKILRMEDSIGTVETGKRADFMVVEKNPLEDLTALRVAKMVVADGHVIENPKVKRIKEIDEALDKLL